MDLFDDYQDEVERLTDAEIDALFSVEDHSARPVATLIRDVRLGLLESPSPDLTARHLAAMASARPRELVSDLTPTAHLGRGRLLPRRRLTAVALAAALLFLAGLAAAVTLPEKAPDTAPESVSTTAPSVVPADEDLGGRTTHGQAVSDVAKDRSLTGCEKGQGVAAVASAKAAEQRNNPAQKNDPCVRAETKGKGKSAGRGDHPAAPRGVAEDRAKSLPAGSPGTATPPGLNREPGDRGFEARSDRGNQVGGGIGAGGLGGGNSSGAVPTDSLKS